MQSFNPNYSRGFVMPYEEVFAQISNRRLLTDDGHQLAYQVIGDGDETLVLANGLGGRLYAWLGLIERLNPRYRIISWDYRGLFESEGASPDLSVHRHASDLLAILNEEQIEAAHLIGWSMGVQVSLEVALRQAQRVASLVLINGTYGQVFSTAFQPFLQLPRQPIVLHGLMEQLRNRPTLLRFTRKGVRWPTEALFWLRKATLGRRQSTLTLGLRQYFRDVSTTDTRAYLQLFQELDAHCVYHRLSSVRAPTTVISGGFDYLTPAAQSRQMARRIPNAQHVNLAMGTHFVLLERPEAVYQAVNKHLTQSRTMTGE